MTTTTLEVLKTPMANRAADRWSTGISLKSATHPTHSSTKCPSTNDPMRDLQWVSSEPTTSSWS
ncbi:hypothetical protein FEG63_29975 [Mycolicibacterium sphagni]|uniref:Uncharacterized protein n=1 Tax=Mycolicibacterium sphagni TaxID=1786 RepID=A0ABX2K3V9_9MYCO|nr:hypothetical protein [Mycolicibacterium sphagni]